MRYFSKKALIAAALLLFFFAPWSVVFCQSNGHFEWAKGFGTGDPNGGACHITGSVTDSLGNLYILGQFRNDSEWGTGWDAERLLPMTPYGPWPDNVNTIIAKISPDGEMVWKKVIHSNNGSHQTPKDIKRVGDTSFACLVEMLLPNEDRYVYYLDTLIPGRSDYPVNSMYVRNSMRTAFIMFDFEGNVLEQHFLHVTYTDTTGNDFVKYYYNDTTPWLSSDRFRYPSFDIDDEGNIFICRASMDWLDDSINAANGTIYGIKFWADNRKVGEYINESRPMFWYPQIMKFSPHFDTMLACRYLVQRTSDSVEYASYDTRTNLDKNGNIYVKIIQELSEPEHNNTIVIDSIQNIIVSHSDLHGDFSYIVKFDSFLTPVYAIYIQDSITGDTSPSAIRTMFHDIAFDEDSNNIFISGYAQKNRNSTATHYIGQDQIPLEKNDAFVIVLDANTGTSKAYAIIPSTHASNLGSIDSKNNLFAQNNRIYLQSKYFGGLNITECPIHIGENNAGLCLVVFDYSGNTIGGIDYNAINTQNMPGSISVTDSILYIAGILRSDATFGNIQFGLNGFSQSTYVAKYVDTSFMTPYVRPTNNTIFYAINDYLVIYPNPAHDRLTVDNLAEPIIKVSAISMSGIEKSVYYENTNINIENLQPGIYILEVVTINNKYHSKIIKL